MPAEMAANLEGTMADVEYMDRTAPGRPATADPLTGTCRRLAV